MAADRWFQEMGKGLLGIIRLTGLTEPQAVELFIFHREIYMCAEVYFIHPDL